MKIYKNIFLLIPLLLTGCQSPTDNNENNGGDENENYIIKEKTTINFLSMSDSGYHD